MTKKRSNDIFPAFFAFFIFLLLTPFLAIVYCLTYLKKRGVAQKLKEKYKDEFFGMLEGRDTIWAMDEGDMRCSVESVFFFETEKDHNHLIDFIHARLKDVLESGEYPYTNIFNCKVLEMDYYFWRKLPHIDMDNYVHIYDFKTPNEEVDYQSVRCFVEESINKPYPINDTAIFDCHVGNKPIMIKNGKNTYPVLIRMHHAMGDGVCMVNWMVNIFRNLIDIEKLDIEGGLDKFKALASRSKIDKWQWWLFKMTGLFYMPLNIYRLVKQPSDENILHGPKLTGKKTIGWRLDKDEDPLWTKIKRIREKIPKASYTEVTLTAISKGFTAYFEKHEDRMHLPDYITLGLTARVEPTVFDPFAKLKCFENKFTIVSLQIPIMKDTQKTSFHERLMGVKSYHEEFKHSTDIVARDYFGRFIFHFPVNRLRKLFVKSPHTLSFNNLPGPPRIHTKDGYHITHMTFGNPIRAITGLALTWVTYDKSIEIAITADTALIEDGKDIDFILDKIVKEIDYMDEYTSKQDFGKTL